MVVSHIVVSPPVDSSLVYMKGIYAETLLLLHLINRDYMRKPTLYFELGTGRAISGMLCLD